MVQVYFYYISSILIWGTTWLPLKLQLGIVLPEISIFYRFALASIILLIWCIFKKLPMRFTFTEHAFMFLLGMTFFSTNYIFVYRGSEYLTSGLVAVIFSLLSVINTINARIFFKERIESQVLLGSIIGVVGLCIIFWPEFIQFDINSQATRGLLLCLIGTYCASLGCMVSAKTQQKNLPVVQTNSYGMLYGAIFLLFIITLKGEPFHFDSHPVYVSSLLYLALFGSAIAFGCYLSLIGKIGPSRAAYTTVLIPIIALVISSIYENYLWTGRVVFALFLIVIGNIFILARPKTMIQGSGRLATTNE